MSQPGIEHWIQVGDLRRAASSLVVTYGQDVLATCMAMVRDRAAAEDVTQEVFGDAIRALSTFRGDSSPRTWLLSIARNRCIDYLRARKRDPWGGALDERLPDPDAHADEDAFDGECLADRLLLLRALDALAEGDRALIVLRFKNGLEYGELATAFGLREGTVRMRVSRALARMRQVLEGDAPRYEAAAGVTPPDRVRAPSAPAAPAYLSRAALVRGGTGASPSGAPLSLWARLKESKLGCRARDAAPMAPLTRPVGALGLALAACEPATPSEALAARLFALVDAVSGSLP